MRATRKQLYNTVAQADKGDRMNLSLLQVHRRTILARLRKVSMLELAREAQDLAHQSTFAGSPLIEFAES
jgi:hypothetical protein